MNTFDAYPLRPFVADTIKELAFVNPTPIQNSVIPLMLKGKDVIGISQTGTGKTHAFLIPIMNQIQIGKDKVQAVITAPTRELASQIFEQVKIFMKHQPDLRAALLIGGKDRQKTISQLSTQPHIVVGTPGRIRDLALNEQALHITTADLLVIDEADMTIDLGYIEDIDAVAGKMKDNLQMAVFSATIPQKIRPFLKKYMHQPKIVEIEAKKVTNEHIEHILIWTRHHDRYEILQELTSIIDPYLCLIFCNTRTQASEIAHRFYEAGIKVGEIHGDLEPRERRAMMRRIKQFDYQYVVATDIAARGIDIDGVSHIINLGFPKELDFYIHRSGRTGRGKYTGICYSLYDTSDEKMVAQLEKKGIQFKNMEIRHGQLVDLGNREKRKSRQKQTSALELEIQKIVKKPVKVKPGYRKKRKQQIEALVRKQKRQIIQQDIRRQKKERARQAQIEKRRLDGE